MKPIHIQTYPLISQEELRPKNKHATWFKAHGIIEVLLGITMITLAAVNIGNAQQLAVDSEVATWVSAMVGSGIWTGTLVLVCGILGLASSAARNQCPVIGAMVLTIMTSLSCFSLVIVEAVGALMVKSKTLLMSLHENLQANGMMAANSRSYPDESSDDSDVLETMFQLHLALIGFGIVSFIVAIVHSAFTCSAACCKKNSYQSDVAMNSTQQYSVQPGCYQNNDAIASTEKE